MRELAHAHDPENVGQWLLTLRPDYAGRSRSGWYVVVFTERNPSPWADSPLWAIGWSQVGLDQARYSALSQLARQKFGREVELLLAERT